MRGDSHEGKAAVDEPVRNALGDRNASPAAAPGQLVHGNRTASPVTERTRLSATVKADDGMPFNAIEDGFTPARWPEIIGLGCELAQGRVRYIGRGKCMADDLADDAVRVAEELIAAGVEPAPADLAGAATVEPSSPGSG
jgi:hypothetical protein